MFMNLNKCRAGRREISPVALYGKLTPYCVINTQLSYLDSVVKDKFHIKPENAKALKVLIKTLRENTQEFPSDCCFIVLMET